LFFYLRSCGLNRLNARELLSLGNCVVDDVSDPCLSAGDSLAEPSFCLFNDASNTIEGGLDGYTDLIRHVGDPIAHLVSHQRNLVSHCLVSPHKLCLSRLRCGHFCLFDKLFDDWVNGCRLLRFSLNIFL